jgi:hypothetical protein
VLFFCLFAGGMVAGIGRRGRHSVRVAVELDAPGTLGNFVNRLGQRGTGKRFSLASLVDPSRTR